MKPVASFALVFALLAGGISAQCSTLTVTGAINFGETVSFDVSGTTPNALTFLAASDDTGSSNFGFGPLGSVTLGLAEPFTLFPLGLSDANGDVGISFDLPALPPGAPTGGLPSSTLYIQAVSIDFTFGFPPSLGFCESNVASVTVGAGA